MPSPRASRARAVQRARRPHRVVAVAYDRLALFELAIVVEVFGLPRPELPRPWYEFRVCAIEPGALRATGALRVAAAAGIGGLDRADTIVVPGWRDPEEPPPARLLSALRRAHRRGARIVSICSGAFVLAAAGLLDGRRATTHWRYAEILRHRYPRVRVEPGALYIDEGRVLTSAGSAAGIDLCIHLVRRDHGAEIANQVARRLVVAPHREGGQAQFIDRPVAARPGHDIARAIEWALAGLARPIAVPQLAREAALSPRTFARRFRAETGTTPHRWLLHQRVLAAQRALETGTASIEEVADDAGFGNAQTLRLHFRRLLGTTPTAYRLRFARRPAARGVARCVVAKGAAPRSRRRRLSPASSR